MVKAHGRTNDNWKDFSVLDTQNGERPKDAQGNVLSYATDGDTSLGMTAENFYTENRGTRGGVVDIGRRLADITIPSVFPPETYNNGQGKLAVTNQGYNALLVNTLATALTLGALPPELPICKFNINESKLQPMINQDPEQYAQITYSLSRREELHRQRLATTGARAVYNQAMRQLLVPGNVLIKWIDIDHPSFHLMHNWVCLRDGCGRPYVTVLEERISLAAADEDVRDAIWHSRSSRGGTKQGKSAWADTGLIYHVQKWVPEDKQWLYWQETEGGYVIEGTDFWSDPETPPMMAAPLIWEPGSDYGLGYASDFEGDLMAFENLSAAIQDGAAAAAWLIWLVNPTGTTKLQDLKKADNLSMLPGKEGDVSALRADKGGDLAWVANTAETIGRRLGQAFAYEASIQRSGERVTKEEWVQMTQALDKAMGGLYTFIAQSIQRWFIKRFIWLHEQEDKTLKPLPKGIVSVGIVTGVDEIGNTAEYSSLLEVGQDLNTLFPQQFQQRAIVESWAQRLMAGKGVKFDGLMKSDTQIAQETQQAQNSAMQQELVKGAAGPLAKNGLSMLQGVAGQSQGGTGNDTQPPPAQQGA